MENENKDIFDYDEYVKTGGKKEKPKKGFQRKSSGAKNVSAPVKSDKPAEEKKATAPKSEKPAEEKKASAPKSEKPTEEKKASAPKSEKPTEEKKTSAPKSEKPAEEKKASAPKSEKPAEEKKAPVPKSEKPTDEKKAAAPKSEKQTEEKKASAPKSEKPTKEKKAPVPKSEKPAEKTSAPKSDKPAEEKKVSDPKSDKPTDEKKNPPEKKEKNKAALKNAGKKLHSSDKEKKEDKIKVKEESIDNIKKMFDGALGEDSEDLAELVTEEPAIEMPKVRAINKSKLYFLFGLAVSVFAVIGIISTIWFTAREVREFTDNTQQKEEFARFIYPVVICDPAPFDLTVKMHNDTVLSAALWDIILYEDKSKYVQDFDYITVPEVDVEKHAVKLFGEGMSFVHKSLLNSEVKFYYEEELKSYRIPAKPRYFTYSPLVESIEREGENYTLTVGYISPTPSYFALNTENDTPTPDKYVEYVVNKHGEEYTLIAINISDKGRDPNLGL